MAGDKSREVGEYMEKGVWDTFLPWEFKLRKNCKFWSFDGGRGVLCVCRSLVSNFLRPYGL